MGRYNFKEQALNVQCFLGCTCIGRAVYDYARCQVSLSDEEVAALRVIYKGKKQRELNYIKSKMPQLYSRISEEVREWVDCHMSHEPMDIEISFLRNFRKL